MSGRTSATLLWCREGVWPSDSSADSAGEAWPLHTHSKFEHTCCETCQLSMHLLRGQPRHKVSPAAQNWLTLRTMYMTCMMHPIPPTVGYQISKFSICRHVQPQWVNGGGHLLLVGAPKLFWGDATPLLDCTGASEACCCNL